MHKKRQRARSTHLQPAPLATKAGVTGRKSARMWWLIGAVLLAVGLLVVQSQRQGARKISQAPGVVGGSNATPLVPSGAGRGAMPNLGANASGIPSNTVAPSDRETHILQLHDQFANLLAAKRFQEAFTTCEELVKLSPGDEDVHFNLAFVSVKLGRTNDAIVHYEKALELFPDYTEARNNLGNLFAALDRLDEAAAQYKAAIDFLPENANAHNNLGTVLARQGKTQEAAAEFTEAIRLMPEYMEARMNLANASLALKDPGTARLQLDHLLSTMENKVTAHNIVGAILSRGGYLKEGLTNFQAALSLSPDSVESRFNVGNTLLLLGNTNAAIAEFNTVLKVRPNFPPALRALERAQGLGASQPTVPPTGKPTP